MIFQDYVNMCSTSCAVLSVEKIENDLLCIRIVCANEKYKKIMGDKYYDNMIYSELVAKDNKFEDFCYQSAFKKKTMHAYVETKSLNSWTEFFLYPLEGGGKNKKYCQFVFNLTAHAQANRLKNVSIEIAEEVIKECVYFHKNRDLENSMEDVCKSILEFSNAMACRVLLLNHQEKRSFTFADYLLEGVIPEGKKLDKNEELPYELVKTWEKTLGSSNCFVLKSKNDFEEIKQKNNEWYKSLKSYNINSLIMVPLYRQKEIIGYLYVTNYNKAKSSDIKKLLELSSFFVSSELSQYDLFKKFEILSKIDELTGLFNRNALNEHFDSYTNGNTKISGIVVLDMNGLKFVNDNYGHFAGDNMIHDGAAMIKEIFADDKVFRIGGDEFLVVTANRNKTHFKKKVHNMINYPNKQIKFAVGAYWLKENENINDAVMIADKLMYINKNEYYMSHPEKDRRT